MGLVFSDLKFEGIFNVIITGSSVYNSVRVLSQMCRPERCRYNQVTVKPQDKAFCLQNYSLLTVGVENERTKYDYINGTIELIDNKPHVIYTNQQLT